MTTPQTDHTPRMAIAVAMAVTPFLALVLTRLLWSGDLPATVASHWSGTTADGFSDTITFFNIVVALAAACALASVIAVWLSRRRPSTIMWLPVGTALSATLASAWIVSVLRTRAADDPQAATLGWWIAVPLLAVAWGLVIYAVLPRDRGARQAADRPMLERPLHPGERAAWFGHIRSIWAGALAGAILVGVIVAAFYGELWLAVTLVLSALLVGALSAVTAQVSAVGFALSSWGLRWKRVPLAQISSASVGTLRPADWGGWGYRISGRGSAMIMRGGDGLILHLVSGRQFAVSVEQPAEGARLLNSLLAQADEEAARR